MSYNYLALDHKMWIAGGISGVLLDGFQIADIFPLTMLEYRSQCLFFLVGLVLCPIFCPDDLERDVIPLEVVPML